MAKADTFAMDTAVAPARIFRPDPHYQFSDHRGHAWATSCRRRLRPEGPVPGHHCRSQPNSVAAVTILTRHRSRGSRPTNARRQQPVLRLQPWPAHLSSQYRHFMAQDQQLNVGRRRASAAERNQSSTTRTAATRHRRPSGDHAERRSDAGTGVLGPTGRCGSGLMTKSVAGSPGRR